MILSRIAKSLLRQDWGAIVIEFAIVVFGIYGRLQVNDWAQERDNRVQEQAQELCDALGEAIGRTCATSGQ